MAVTGQMAFPVHPRKIWTPLRKWLVFDCLIVTLMREGEFLLSTAISLIERWAAGSKSLGDAIVNSLHLKNPKKQYSRLPTS